MPLKYIRREFVNAPGRTAVVIGATGATGSKVLDLLLARAEWEKVVVVSRRPVPQQHEKLVMVVTELDDESLVKTKEHWKGATNVFNCIGTTRKQAKSAKAFVAVEVGITESTTRIAKEAGVLHYSVVSAQGASTKLPAVSWFHPFLYTNTMGRKQQTVIDAKVGKHVCDRLSNFIGVG
jgi:oxidoreductase